MFWVHIQGGLTTLLDFNCHTTGVGNMWPTKHLNVSLEHFLVDKILKMALKMILFEIEFPKAHFFSKIKFSGTYTGLRRTTLFLVWPASQKELSTPGVTPSLKVRYDLVSSQVVGKMTKMLTLIFYNIFKCPRCTLVGYEP